MIQLMALSQRWELKMTMKEEVVAKVCPSKLLQIIVEMIAAAVDQIRSKTEEVMIMTMLDSRSSSTDLLLIASNFSLKL